MTTQEVEAKLAERNIPWDDFQHWMRGQTVGMNEDGSTNWYEYDVNRFIRYRVNGTKESSAEFD